MIGGTAMMAGRASARNAQRETSEEARISALEQQQAPAPTAGGTDIASTLTQLKQLVDQGALTPEEFDTAKQKLLAG
jgi:hypothetical protein